MRMLLSVVFLFFALTSCGYQEGIVKKSDRGFLWFTGRTDDATVKIDEAEPFSLKEGNVVYQITPGQHTIKVFRNGRIVIDRVLFIDSQFTKEVELP